MLGWQHSRHNSAKAIDLAKDHLHAVDWVGDRSRVRVDWEGNAQPSEVVHCRWYHSCGNDLEKLLIIARHSWDSDKIVRIGLNASMSYLVGL